MKLPRLDEELASSEYLHLPSFLLEEEELATLLKRARFCDEGDEVTRSFIAEIEQELRNRGFSFS